MVGGEIYYTKKGTNLYELVFKIYFDCENANPGTIDRDGGTANLAIFNARTNDYIRSLTLTNGVDAEVNTVNYECVKTPAGVCVVEYTFSRTITLDPGTDGVIISHQLCCRNDIIDNVFNPGETGSTYWCFIPPSSISNSSPRFSKLPPTYVCLNAPLVVDYSATDPDGDSLVYELFTPYIGASSDDPKPNTPSAPPYSALTWGTGFSSFNQITGNPTNFINRSTGEYSLTPTQTGIYTVGVKVTEYRNGVAISATLRDYQFAVVQCQFDILANFDIPSGTAVGGAYSFECGDTVCITNKSFTKFPNSTKYFWDFGDPTTTRDTLTTFNLAQAPCYTYPGNGNYTIKLTASSSICESNYKYDVRIRSSKSFDLGPDLVFCDDFQIRLDTKTADAVAVNWNTGQTGFRITVSDTGKYIATVSYGNCSYKDSVTLRYDKVPPLTLPSDSLFCDSVNIVLDAGVPGLFYQWSTSVFDNQQTVSVNDTGKYSVIVRNLNCISYDTIRLWLATAPKLEDQFFCNNFTFEADASAIEEAQYKWSTGETTQKITLNKADTYWVQTKQRHCVKSDTFTITNPVIQLELGIDTHFCDFINLELDAGQDGIQYDWSNGANTQIINVTTPGTYIVTVFDSFGCENTDTIVVTVSESPIFELGDDMTICLNSPTTLKGPPGYDYKWNVGSTEASITTVFEGPYTLTITDEYGCIATDSLYITVDPDALPNELFVPSAFSPNDDGLNELFPYSVPINQPAYYVIIFSRWGEKVFDSRDDKTKQNWDGYYKGEKAHNQMFVYFMYYRGCDGNARSSKGNVYPLR